jgi:GNAT superfamily N-acetyltransferase
MAVSCHHVAVDGTSGIRPARLDDARGLADAWVEFGREYAAIDSDRFRVPDRRGLVEWFESNLERERSDELSLIAERGGRIVGFLDAQIWHPADDADLQIMREPGETVLKIDALMVKANDRRAGLATKLMKAAEAWGRERGATRSVVISYAHSPTSVPFYEKGMGYARTTIGYGKQL